MTSPSQLLRDVLESGRAIQSWCASRTFQEYETDRQLRRAVEREFEIIGEALARLARTTPGLADRIGHLPRIVGFRNRIIHGYDVIDHATVWGVVAGYLPPLMTEVEQILSELEKP